MGAPVGNQNARKAKLFENALRRALARSTGESVDAGLDKGADQLVRAYHEGQPWAIKEVRDTLDGKPAQSLTVGGDDENPLKTVSEVILRAVD